MKILPGWLILALVVLTSCNENEQNPDGLSTYQEDVISYFKEIALGFDGLGAEKVTRKWRVPMKVFVGGEASEILDAELEDVILEINALVSDGFRIEEVTDSTEANYYVYFGSARNYMKIYPLLAPSIEEDPGLFNLLFNQQAEFFGGHMYVDIDRVSLIQQKHLLREGLTQSIGLARDSDRIERSIFQVSPSDVTEFADIDRDLVRLLYHPDMVVGVDALAVDAILRKIFQKENLD